MRKILATLVIVLTVQLSIAQEDSNATMHDTIYSFVEEMPQFPGGDTAMMGYIANNLHCDSDNQMGKRILVAFVITKTGSISDVKVMKGIENGCCEAVLTLIRRMPAWTPGKHLGTAVDVQQFLPIQLEPR